MTVLAADVVSGGETVAFWILGPIALAGAIGMVLSRNAIHSALWLVLTMLSLGAFYFIQQAPFLGAVQVIVYTGAIMILFLFVLMLVGRDYSDSIVETLRGQRLAAIVLGVGFAGLVGGLIANATSGVESVGLAEVNADGGNIPAIARLLFTDYLLAFELTSALLITAAVGAMILAHIEREPGSRPGQREQSIARVKGPRPQTLPGPGVFARANSVASPALLPDGSVAKDSRATGVEMRQPPALASGSVDRGDDITVDSGANRAGVPSREGGSIAARNERGADRPVSAASEAEQS